MVLEATGLRKRLGERMVLRDVSFSLMSGDSGVMVGPNGAGKTTLLKVLAGVWKPSAGTLSRFGQVAAGEGADHRVGYLGHQSFLYRALTGRENLVFYARLYGVPKPEQAAVDALKRVGMDRFQHDPVRRYSRGMEQRVAIARAFLGKPELLLLDEPYTGLDVQAAGLLDRLIEETMEAGGASLLITHHLDEAARVGNRYGILWNGRLVRWTERGTDALPQLADEYQGFFASRHRRA